MNDALYDMETETIAGMHTKLAESGPASAGAVRRRGRQLNETFVDAICDEPHVQQE